MSPSPSGEVIDRLRSDLVQANRILVQQRVLDAFGHVSVRTGRGAETFLMSRNLAPGAVRPEDILLHDLDGDVESSQQPYLERFIHAEIYRSRTDVVSVVHSHSPAVIPFSVVDVPLRPVLHMASFLAERPPSVFEIREHAGQETDLLITSSALGRALATTLADQPVTLMRGHGSVSVGSSLQEAVFRAVYTEVNARCLSESLAMGVPKYLTVGEGIAGTVSVSSQITRAWEMWRVEASAPYVATEHQGQSHSPIRRGAWK